jgi:phenol 2-monooxygenase
MGISEFPHLIVNQARVLDYFARVMANSPTRLKPDYGYEFQQPQRRGRGRLPRHRDTPPHFRPNEGQERVVRAKYVVGADGARSKVREAIGCTLAGDQANHAWGVMDVLASTDFPDIRTKCAIQGPTTAAASC